jgi:hypothetical protein
MTEQDRGDLGSSFANEFELLHRRLREVASGLDDAALNRSPKAGENSIATLIKHTLGSERMLLYAAAGTRVDRDRDEEFRGTLSTDELAPLFAEADRVLSECLGPSLEHCAAGGRTEGSTTRTAGWLLIRALTHSAEHLAHAELTRALIT